MFKKILLGILALAIIGIGLNLNTVRNTTLKLLTITAPWQYTFAQSKSELATIHTFPYLFNYFLLDLWGKKTNSEGNRPFNTLNQFYHSSKLTNAKYRNGGSPNNDTLYSIAWIYVEQQPIIISVPPMDRADRYWTFEIASFNSDNYAYMGMRTTGMDGGNYAIVPPGWEGILPDNVEFLAEAETRWSLILGRTLVIDDNDIANVAKLQQQYTITELDNWGESQHRVPYYPAIPKLAPEYSAMFADKSQGFKAVLTDIIKNNPQKYIDIVNQVMAMTDVPVADRSDIDQYRELGFGAGLTADDTAADFVAGRNVGVSLGLIDTVSAMKTDYSSKNVNGWKILDPDFGRAGQSKEYLFRASVQSLGGIIANDPVEAMYFVLTDDTSEDGMQKPVGTKNYKMHFTKDQLPDVKAFWSMSLYDDTQNLVANSIDRYSLGDRSPSLRYDADGGLTIYISQHPPADASLEGNWLPSSDAEFFLIFRTYLPGKEIVDQHWAPPPLELVK